MEENNKIDFSQASYWKSTPILREVIFKSSLSGGAGGQNVNKVSTKMELYWTPNNSSILSTEQKVKVITKLGNSLSKEGEIRVVCDEERSQLKNKEKAIEKFFDLIASCFKVKKKRKPTKKTKSSQEKRLNSKSQRKDVKANRRKPDH